MVKEDIREIAKKNNYDDNMQIAIIYCLNAMISVYGEEAKDDLIKLLTDVPIHFLYEITPEEQESIKNSHVGNLNSHIVAEEVIDPYGNSSNPGSYYSTETIFDENMNAVDQLRWMVIKDMGKTYNKDGYIETFGTTINVPYLLHELNHAYAMQKPLIKVEGNQIYEKKGMFITKSSFRKEGDKVFVKDEFSNDILLEEAFNEYLTLQMLANSLGLESPDDVNKKLYEFHHVSSSYSPIIMHVANSFYKFFGDKVMAYRRDNDDTMIKKFNDIVLGTEIGKSYLAGKVPYEVVSEYVKKSFLLTCECFRHSVEEYKELQAQNTYHLVTPILAYEEHLGTYTMEDFDAYRERLGIQKEDAR